MGTFTCLTFRDLDPRFVAKIPCFGNESVTVFVYRTIGQILSFCSL